MLTLNQIKNRLVEYLNSHAQINQVVYGDNYKFAADRNLIYPVSNVEWVESNVSGRLVGHTFRVILADRTNPNIDTIDDDIDSDMLLIADDFFAWLEEQEGFILTKTSQIVKLTDEYGDRISGIRFRIILSTVRRSNDCETPKKIIPSATFLINGDNNDAIIQSISSGTFEDNIATNTAHVDVVTVTFQMITDISNSETLFATAYTIPEGFTVSNAIWNYEDYVNTYTVTGYYDSTQNWTFDFTSLLDVTSTFLYDGSVDTDSMSIVVSNPATYHPLTGQIVAFNGSTVIVNITMPWLGGLTFQNDYDLPVGLTLNGSFTYSGLYWNLDLSYVAEDGFTFDFQPNPPILYAATYKLNGENFDPANLYSPSPSITINEFIISSYSNAIITIQIDLERNPDIDFLDAYIIPDGLTLASVSAADLMWQASFTYQLSADTTFDFISESDLVLQYNYINGNGVNGSFNILLNGGLVANFITTTGGTINISSGDSVEVQVNNTDNSSITITYNSVLHLDVEELGNLSYTFLPPINSSPVHITAISQGA